MGAGAKIGMKVIGLAVGIPVSIATRKLVHATWSAARPKDAPVDPENSSARWGDAIAWAALSAAGIVVAELATRRGTETAFRAITGLEPPPAKKTKAQKKLDKAEAKAAGK